ncbi:MAG: MlaD family protein [Gammaproteobacteria bacterium]|nr:MlaD family protein [Gammaproteobacteria bacterium]
METRAKHLLVGIFVLLSLFGLLFFVGWLVKTTGDQTPVRYQTLFEGSVTGLELGSDVRYRGIKAGNVTSIDIDPADPSKVIVSMAIDSKFLLREGDTTSLEVQGLTGVAYVNIQGATPNSPYLTISLTESTPVPSEESRVEKLFTSVPELMVKTVNLLDQLNHVFSDKNVQKLSSMVDNLNSFSQMLQDNEAQITTTLTALNQSLQTIDYAAERVSLASDSTVTFFGEGQKTLAGVNQLLDDEIPAVATSLNRSLQNLVSLSSNIDDLLSENREPIRSFTGETLPGIGQFVDEARVLVYQLDQIVEKLQSEGALFLISGEHDGFTEIK